MARHPKADRVQAVCPCCSARLTVDVETGEILAHERPKKSADRTLREALDDLDENAKRRDAVFDDVLHKTKRHDDLLNKKFEEAQKRAEKEPGGRPPNPLDFD